MAHACSFRINIDIVDMHIVNSSILDVSDAFQNKNVPIYEIVCFSSPPYYLDWFERYHPILWSIFYVLMEFKEQNQLEDNGIDSLIQWSPLFNKIRKILSCYIHQSLL